MEELCCRFPVLGQLMFDNLDEESLNNCKEASKVVSQFVINERFFWIRMIRKYYKNLIEFKSSWEMIIHKTSADILKKLAIVVHCFFTKDRLRFAFNWSPFHIAAQSGLMQLCRHVYQKSDIHQLENKNPVNKKVCTSQHARNHNYCDLTPLHLSAQNGHLHIYRLITDTLEDKNPVNSSGITPLHLSAKQGYLEICQLIIESLDNKNPADRSGNTPLHLSARNGHLEICQLIMNTLENLCTVL